MATIAFFEKEPSNGSDRFKFHEYARSLKIVVYHDAQNLLEHIPDVLFYHETDEKLLLDAGFNASLKGRWRICYGGGATKMLPCKDQTLGYLSVRDLGKDLGAIVLALQEVAFDSITCDYLFALCFSIDPTLEELLTPFATSSPFKAPSSPQAKEKLDAYIAEKLGAPGS